MKIEMGQAHPNTGIVPAESRRWMLVDDNADILRMLTAVLEHFTTATIECHDSPQSALAAFTAAPGNYELVFTDFEMPCMDGIELCRWLRKLSPELKIFLSTGSGFFTRTAARHAGFCELLNKPFSFASLCNALAGAGVETTAQATA